MQRSLTCDLPWFQLFLTAVRETTERLVVAQRALLLDYEGMAPRQLRAHDFVLVDDDLVLGRWSKTTGTS
jgi:hypothetical protein